MQNNLCELSSSVSFEAVLKPLNENPVGVPFQLMNDRSGFYLTCGTDKLTVDFV